MSPEWKNVGSRRLHISILWTGERLGGGIPGLSSPQRRHLRQVAYYEAQKMASAYRVD